MAIAAGYQIQGINRDINVAVKAIRGSISRPAQLMVGEYIAWHVWMVNVENALVLIWPYRGDGACFRYLVEGRYRDEIDWVDENTDYDILAEIIPLQNDPSAYGSIRFCWRNRKTGESKVRSYAFSQYRIAKAVDLHLNSMINLEHRKTQTGNVFTTPRLEGMAAIRGSTFPKTYSTGRSGHTQNSTMSIPKTSTSTNSGRERY